MYELRIERSFRAAHAIVMQGELETSHVHAWRVVVDVEADELDADGLLCDFHRLEGQLDAIIAPFAGGDLNVTPPFDQVNPTAEHVARHVAEALRPALDPGVRLLAVRVTESPGCVATYRP